MRSLDLVRFFIFPITTLTNPNPYPFPYSNGVVFLDMLTLKELLNDNIRGSTSIFKDSITLFLSENDPGTIKNGVEKLKETFPVMGLFVNLWIRINTKDTVEEIHNILNDIHKLLERTFNQVIENAGNQLPNECRIMTISHSSYVRELIINNKEKINIVYCLESAPEFEGKELAILLKENGIDAYVAPDTNYYSSQRSGDPVHEVSGPLTNVTHVIVGSDLISEHFFINKSGTNTLTELAVEQGKNVWILGDDLRFVPDYVPENIPEAFEMIRMKNEFRVFK